MQRIKTFLFASVTALAAVLAQSVTASAQSPPQIFKGAPPSAWSFDGLFVSLSAGGTLTHGSVANQVMNHSPKRRRISLAEYPQQRF
jgi:hypothetical protein